MSFTITSINILLSILTTLLVLILIFTSTKILFSYVNFYEDDTKFSTIQINGIESWLVENRFISWDTGYNKQESINKNFVIKTCDAIAQGYYNFNQWDKPQEYYCNKLSENYAK